jgi:DNA-binding PadR family transcriptional regulator
MPTREIHPVADVARHLPLRPVACAVLAALAHGPRPGIDVLEAVNATVPGRPILGPGSLYRLLKELRQEKLIARGDPDQRASGEHDDRQVHHVLTALGEAVLKGELSRLRRTITLAERARPAPQR